MFFWFLGTAATTVWFVFRDDRFDYRVLAVGVLSVDVVDAALGGSRVMHSVMASVLLLAVVMLLTSRGTSTRRRLLALPIGTFLHLVFDGAFSNARVFWWPMREIASVVSSDPIRFGSWWSTFDGISLPSVERGAVNIILEIIGIALLVRLWRTHGLGDATVRRRFIADGRLVEPSAPSVGKC